MQLHSAVGEIVITPASVVGALAFYGIGVAAHATHHQQAFWAMGGYALTNLAVGLPVNVIALDLLGAAILRPLSLAAGVALIHHFMIG